jgi:hypothetical protein
MVKELLLDVAKSGKYTKKEFSRLPFIKDFTGPKYNVIPRDEYESLIDSIKNNSFDLKMFTPMNKEITDIDMKKNLLGKLFYHHKYI